MLEVSQLIGFGAGGGGIQFVGANKIATSGVLSLTALTGGIDSAARAGDLVIVAIGDGGSVDTNLSISTPSGYTEVADLYSNGSGVDPELGVYWKLMTATPDTSVTIPAYTDSCGIAYVLRGVNQSNPLDATTTTATSTTGNPDPPSITTVTANALVVAIMASISSDQNISSVAPSGYTNLSNVPLGSASYDNPDTNLAIASKVVASPGAENPGTFTGPTVVASGWCAATLAIRPA